MLYNIYLLKLQLQNQITDLDRKSRIVKRKNGIDIYMYILEMLSKNKKKEFINKKF